MSGFAALLWLPVVAVLGGCAGSYLGVVVDRVPAGRALAEGSRCGTCHRPVRAGDNVPVLSYLWLRGRCRDCRTPIPALWWRLEVAASLGWTTAAALVGPGPLLVVLLLASWVLLLAGALTGTRRGDERVMTPAAAGEPAGSVSWAVWAAAALPVLGLALVCTGLGVALQAMALLGPLLPGILVIAAGVSVLLAAVPLTAARVDDEPTSTR